LSRFAIILRKEKKLAFPFTYICPDADVCSDGRQEQSHYYTCVLDAGPFMSTLSPDLTVFSQREGSQRVMREVGEQREWTNCRTMSVLPDVFALLIFGTQTREKKCASVSQLDVYMGMFVHVVVVCMFVCKHTSSCTSCMYTQREAHV
jgi:hypothetical protein